MLSLGLKLQEVLMGRLTGTATKPEDLSSTLGTCNRVGEGNEFLEVVL